mmetsp:Transcript_75313/g.194163  ORF Transcript_75313/g.194163 Transcript_75313/m.194163 type:complete len:95 (+) Transcript_75313:1416-1700(+)
MGSADTHITCTSLNRRLGSYLEMDLAVYFSLQMSRSYTGMTISGRLRSFGVHVMHVVVLVVVRVVVVAVVEVVTDVVDVVIVTDVVLVPDVVVV